MPTPKQVRTAYRKIMFHHRELCRALNDAHNLGVLTYEDYDLESPCKTNFETESRIWDTTREQLAKAMSKEVLKGMK